MARLTENGQHRREIMTQKTVLIGGQKFHDTTVNCEVYHDSADNRYHVALRLDVDRSWESIADAQLYLDRLLNRLSLAVVFRD